MNHWPVLIELNLGYPLTSPEEGGLKVLTSSPGRFSQAPSEAV